MSDAEDRTAGERVLARVTGALGLAMVGVALLWSAGVHQMLRLAVYTEQFLALVLGLALAHAFLALPIKSLPPRVGRAIDLSLAAVALAGGVGLAIAYPDLAQSAAINPASALPVALALILTLVLALLRVAGWPLTVIILIFGAYGLWGSNLPGQFQALSVAPERLAVQLSLDSGGILGTPLAIAATVVVVFVAFGKLLEHLGGAAFFTDLATSVMGGYRGGAAKISILASGLFGSISGSAVSNVATTGVVTIPLMRRGGFRPETAAGIEAVASTGGQLAPPVMGAAAFLMAEFLNVPYSEVILAALVPAILYYLAIFIIADMTAARDGIRGVPADERPRPGATLRAGWPFLLPFAALIWGLFGLNLQPEAAGILAGLVLLVTSPLSRVARGRIGPLKLLGALAGAGHALSQIVIITAAAGIVIGVMNETGLGFGLTSYLIGFAGDQVIVLLGLAALVSIVLGMGMPTIAVYVLLATLIAPALTELGVQPIAAHLFVLYFGMMSMITPPVAIAAFAAATISGAKPMSTSFQAMLFGWPAYVLPFAFAMNPALILQGGLWAAGLSVIAAILGVFAVSAAMVGHVTAPLTPAVRTGALVLGAAGLAWPLLA